MATRIQSGERAKGEKDFWGYVWQGGVDEDLTCSSLEWQMSDAGGRIIEDDKTISVNNPSVIRAWQRAARWVGSISPPGVVAYGKWDAQNVWGSGKAAFLRGWQSDYSLITHGWPFSESRSHRPTDTVTQFGITSVPGGTARRVSTLGGNGLAVSQTSAHPREALELIRFLLRRDVLLMRANAAFRPTQGSRAIRTARHFRAVSPAGQFRATWRCGGASLHSCRPQIRRCEPNVHRGRTFRADWREDSVGRCCGFGEAIG